MNIMLFSGTLGEGQIQKPQTLKLEKLDFVRQHCIKPTTDGNRFSFSLFN
jgi:hypothetical protein